MAADLLGIGSEQLAVMRAAPVPFIGAVSVVSTGIFGLMAFLYGETFKKRQRAIEDRDREIADLTKQLAGRDIRIKALEGEVASLKAERRDQRPEPEHPMAITFHGAGPDPIAPENLKLIDLRKAVAARRLNDVQKVSIPLSLVGVTGRLDLITASNADLPDGLRDDLREAFRDAGWRVETMTSISADPSRAGLQLVVSDPENLTEVETRVHEALFGAQIPHDLIRSNKSVEAEIRIVKRAL